MEMKPILNIHIKVYDYITNNKTIFYEYCFIEDNKYYINAQKNNKNIKYFIKDYFENIKTNGFYGGFMEIHALSIIYNKPINVLVLKYDYQKKIYYYAKILSYIFINEKIINIDDIIDLSFENNNYNLLFPNKIFIVNELIKLQIIKIQVML